MSLNQSFISDFSECSRWSQRTKNKISLHYGWGTGRRFSAAILNNTSCSEGCKTEPIYDTIAYNILIFYWNYAASILFSCI